MITTTNITSHEFIGLNTKIVESSNPQIIGLNGIIIDETKSMFTLNTKRNQINCQSKQQLGILNWKFFSNCQWFKYPKKTI